MLAEPVVHPDRPQSSQQRDGRITELASGYPGYNGVVPFENGFLSEMLVEHGYSTFLVGKYHLTPSNQETAVGPVRPVAARAWFPALLWLPRR